LRIGFFAADPGLFDGGLDNKSSMDAPAAFIGGLGGPPEGGPAMGGAAEACDGVDT